jgi:hypothetical protein
LGNIETFEMDKYYKLFPDLVEKIGGTINDTIKEFLI